MTIHSVLHTDDDSEIREQMLWRMDKFGIKTATFATNEEALKSVKQGTHYAAAIVDYSTASDLRGTDLIVALAAYTDCGEPLVLSSSADRDELTGELARAKTTLLSQTQNVSPQLQERLGRIDIFDKTSEAGLAAIFVAARILFPEETRDLRRKDYLVYLVGTDFIGDEISRLHFDRFYEQLTAIVDPILSGRDQSIRVERLRAFVGDVCTKRREIESFTGGHPECE